MSKFAALVEARGTTIKQVAEATGIDAAQIYNMTSKGNVPRAEVMSKLAEALNAPTDYFARDDWSIMPIPSGWAAAFTDSEIMNEAGRRLEAKLVVLFDALKRFHDLDWQAIKQRFSDIEVGEDVPRDLCEAV